jgi:hypothetical protein
MRRAAFFGVALCLGLSTAATGALAQDAAQPAAQPAAAAQPAPTPKAAPVKAKKAKVTKPAEWTGTWSGPVAQVGRAKSFAFEVTLAGKTGQTSYPDDHCSGKLVRAGTSGNYAFFTETITTGKLDAATGKGCLDGTLTFVKDGSGLVMTWMAARNGKAIVAYGTLVPRN